MELDLHRLELRFAATRISDALAVQRLANSIEANGQLVECVAAGEPADVALVLIDGYRRVAALCGACAATPRRCSAGAARSVRRWRRCSPARVRARSCRSRKRCCCAS